MGRRMWAAAAAMLCASQASAAVHEIRVDIDSPENAGRFTPYVFPVVHRGELLYAFITLPEPVDYEYTAALIRLFGKTESGFEGVFRYEVGHGDTRNSPISLELAAFYYLPPHSGAFKDASDPIHFYGYSIMVGVPEPSTWAMMLIGFAGLGFMFRRTKTIGRRTAVSADLTRL